METINIRNLEIEKGLSLKSFRFKRLYAITLEDTIKSFHRYTDYQPGVGSVNAYSDDEHLNAIITECANMLKENISLQIVKNSISEKHLELVRTLTEFAKLEGQYISYEAVFAEDEASGALIGSLFYSEISSLRFAYTRMGEVDILRYQVKEKEILAKYIPKDRFEKNPELFTWLLN